MPRTYRWIGFSKVRRTSLFKFGDVVCSDGLSPIRAFYGNNSAASTKLIFSGVVGFGWVVSGLVGQKVSSYLRPEESCWRLKNQNAVLAKREKILSGVIDEAYARPIPAHWSSTTVAPTSNWAKYRFNPKSKPKPQMNLLYAKPHPFFGRETEKVASRISKHHYDRIISIA